LDSTGQRKHINPVAAVIQDEIARSGNISFARFMELALYHPDHGYYRKNHIGKAGDFFTSVSVGPLFGQMLAFFLTKQLSDLDGEIHIVEAGANDGSLAADILSWLSEHRPDFAARVQYLIVEPIPELQERQREKIREIGRVPARRGPPRAPRMVEWFTSIPALPPIQGAIISNELLDAFPIHTFRWHAGEGRWCEYGVNAHLQFAPLDDLPGWSLEPLSSLKPLEPHLPDQFTVEFSPAAEQWWRTAATKLTRGFLLAFDYGDESESLWSPSRAQGTVRAFRNHKLISNPLADPGEQDLTASVNFTRIRNAGESAGLISSPLQTQTQFLTKIAAEFLTNPTATQVRQFRTLTHPNHLGRAFKLLLQKR
jgi:SAM-dependent MidA family methyltransferase